MKPADNPAKRKREESAPGGPQPQRPRTGPNAPINAPRGPSGSGHPGLSGPTARGQNVSRVSGHPGLSGPPRDSPVANAGNGYKGPPTSGPPGVSFPN
jgi:senataxin